MSYLKIFATNSLKQIFCRMYGLAVMLSVATQIHHKNIEGSAKKDLEYLINRIIQVNNFHFQNKKKLSQNTNSIICVAMGIGLSRFLFLEKRAKDTYYLLNTILFFVIKKMVYLCNIEPNKGGKISEVISNSASSSNKPNQFTNCAVNNLYSECI